jgi:hypothetical protein
MHFGHFYGHLKMSISHIYPILFFKKQTFSFLKHNVGKNKQLAFFFVTEVFFWFKKKVYKGVFLCFHIIE